MVILEDGAGTGLRAKVNVVNRLDVSARQNPRTFYISRDDGQVYTLISEDATAVSGEEVMYLQNTSSTKKLFVDRVLFSVDTNSKWRIKFVQGSDRKNNSLLLSAAIPSNCLFNCS